MTKLALAIDSVPADKLKLHPRNPRDGNIPAIRESIRHNGWHGVLVAQASTGYILAGNHRYRAALEERAATNEASPAGMEVRDGQLCFPVHWVDVSDDHAVRILLADNRTSDLAGNDEAATLVMLVEVEVAGALQGMTREQALAGTVFTVEDVEQLTVGLEIAPVEPWNNTPEHNLERYLATDLRQITVIMESAEYGPVIDTMLAIQKREEMETNKDVFIHLLRMDPAGADLAKRIATVRAEGTLGLDAEIAATAMPSAQGGTPDAETDRDDDIDTLEGP